MIIVIAKMAEEIVFIDNPNRRSKVRRVMITKINSGDNLEFVTIDNGDDDHHSDYGTTLLVIL